MSKPKMPLDAWENPIPVLGFKSEGGAHPVAATSSSTRNTTPFDSNTKVISIYATVPVYLRFGDNTVTATTSDHHFPEGLYYEVPIIKDDGTSHTHVAVIRAGTTDGIFHVSERE